MDEVKNTEIKNSNLEMKEPISRVILSLIYYNCLVRDTLEYVLKRPTYDVNFFKYKQNGIINEIQINSPLKRFIDTNGEKGQELLKKLEDFGELIYGNSSTILKLADDGLRVDHAQHVTLLENILPIHEELYQIILLHQNAAKKENKLEDCISNLIKADERYYRSIAFLAIFSELREQFNEFNKIMSENRGQRTAASNFVEKDISKLVGLFNLTRQRSNTTDSIYTTALDNLSNLIEMMGGKRDLPTGLKWQDEYKNVLDSINAFIADAEPKFKTAYEPLLRQLAKESLEAKAKREKESNNKE